MSDDKTTDPLRQLVSELLEISIHGFEGIGLEEVIEIRKAAQFAEEQSKQRRLTAEKRLNWLLNGAYEVRQEVAGLIPNYRLAVYKQHFGVRKGQQIFDWLEDEVLAGGDA